MRRESLPNAPRLQRRVERPYSYRDDPVVPPFADDKPLIVFDGVCVLCSSSAQFVMRHDPAGQFRLTAAQSPLGQGLYRHYGLDPTTFDTILLIEDGRLFQRSDAALRVAKRLRWPWAAASLLALAPRAARDSVYDLVARSRYRIFGQREACFVPTREQAGRFV